MSDIRELLQSYARETGYAYELDDDRRELFAPAAFDALRAVLDVCDREDDEGGVGIVPSFLVRTAIRDALEAGK